MAQRSERRRRLRAACWSSSDGAAAEARSLLGWQLRRQEQRRRDARAEAAPVEPVVVVSEQILEAAARRLRAARAGEGEGEQQRRCGGGGGAARQQRQQRQQQRRRTCGKTVVGRKKVVAFCRAHVSCMCTPLCARRDGGDGDSREASEGCYLRMTFHRARATSATTSGVFRWPETRSRSNSVTAALENKRSRCRYCRPGPAYRVRQTAARLRAPLRVDSETLEFLGFPTALQRARECAGRSTPERPLLSSPLVPRERSVSG